MLRILHLIRQSTSDCHLPLKGKAKSMLANKKHRRKGQKRIIEMTFSKGQLIQSLLLEEKVPSHREADEV